MEMVNDPKMWKIAKSVQRVLGIGENVHAQFDVSQQFRADGRLTWHSPFLWELGANFSDRIKIDRFRVIIAYRRHSIWFRMLTWRAWIFVGL